MKNRLAPSRLLAIPLLGLMLAGCATYYPASRDSGVYYETPRYRTVGVAYVDPLVYPYWSLDYFYYSRYYHPYSVVVHRYDPWYYPYPGWYYGYWPGPRYAGHHGRHYSPWYRYGDPYAGYRPWYSSIHLSFGSYRHDHRDNRYRVRELDARLRELETRRSLAVRSQRPDRQLMPGAGPWLPASSRGGAVRRGDATSIRQRGGLTRDAGDRTRQQQTLIQRLRTIDRNAPAPDRREIYRHRAPVASPPSTRERRARRPDVEPVLPSRQRSAPPTPPRSQPQRAPSREPARRSTRSEPRARRDEPRRRERR